MGDRRGAYRVLVRDLRDNNPLENQGLDGRIILKLMLKQWNGEACPGFIWFRIGKRGGIL
jgi:hypothetical protein